ncbi:MAG TPA: hypothetical protein VEF71_02230 [Streptosporangiaceae bacterium]|nr:hypothetical protein [Streptosporangiaceae bacterium]
MIRRARNIVAVAGTAAVLTVAWAGAAAAASIPLVSNSNGTAGYYGADDNHTHYRFVQTVVTATPQLVSLNGEGTTGRPGAVGAELCDPNIGDVAQISLAWNPKIGNLSPKPPYAPIGGYQVKYAFGNFGNFSAPDPCIQTGFVKYAAFWNKGTVLSNFTINQNDRIYLGIYYNPNQANSHFQQISYGVCDITQGVCRQAWSASRYSLNFWEFGIGAFANNVALTAPAFSAVTPFTNNEVTCYSCSGAIPISKVTPVNSFGIGGLTEAQFVNGSSQVIMSPNNSLNAAGDFTVYNGSTTP